MRKLRLFVLALIATLLLAPTFQARAQSKTLVWDRYDVSFTIQPNGDLRVVEHQQITFTSGTFTHGYRVIPLDKTNGISDVSISEPGGQTYQQVGYSGTPNTFTAEQSGGNLEIYWYFPQLSDTTRSYDIAYTVHGGVRIYDTGDKLQWFAIDNQRDFPIKEASATVFLPPGAKFMTIDSSGVSTQWRQSPDGMSVTFVADNGMSASDQMEIGVEFTHGIIPANPPAWQANVDQAESYDRTIRPALNLIVGLLAVLLALGGPLGVYLLWYARGRDPKIPDIPEYITEPPDDLPPGILGTLIDERADMQDVVASIVDLARRGYLTIQESEAQGFLGLASTEFVFHKTKDDYSELNDYEREIMRGIFIGNRTERDLSDLKNKFYTRLPDIQKDLYKQLVSHGFFKASPDRTRKTWIGIGIGVLVIAFVSGFVLIPLATFAGALTCLPLALGVSGVAALVAGNFMPAKTRAGAEATERWKAFKTFLARIDQLKDIKESSDLFEKYLPYAIAFGMNQSWVHKFSTLTNTPAPIWYIPYGRPMAMGGEGRPGGLASTMPGMSGSGSGGLQGMSDNLSGGLQSMSDGLTQMLNSTGRVLGSAPSSSGSGGGGGFSSGGFSGGGGGGGGSAGFG
jgi:hypothetical protein